MAFGYSQPTSAADPANLHSSIGHIISWLSLKAIEGFKFSFFPHTANNYSHSAAFLQSNGCNWIWITVIHCTQPMTAMIAIWQYGIF